MNPVYTGKDVSYIDTKQAQRAIETAVAEARAVRHPGLAGRGAVPARGAGQGVAAAGLRRAPRRHHRGRVRPGLPGPARRLAGGLGAGLGARARTRAAHLSGPAGSRRGPEGRSGCSTGWRGRGSRWPRSRCRCRRTAPGGSSSATGRAAGAGPGRGRPAARGRVAGRGDAHVPGPRRAGPRVPDLPAAPAGAGAPAAAAWRRSAGRRTPSRTAGTGHRGSGAGRDGQRHDKRTGASVLAGPGNELVIQESTRSIPGTARGRGTCRPRGRDGLVVGPGRGAGGAVPGRRRLVARSRSTGSR